MGVRTQSTHDSQDERKNRRLQRLAELIRRRARFQTIHRCEAVDGGARSLTGEQVHTSARVYDYGLRRTPINRNVCCWRHRVAAHAHVGPFVGSSCARVTHRLTKAPRRHRLSQLTLPECQQIRRRSDEYGDYDCQRG